MKPSTRAFFKLHGWRNLGNFLHGYIYGRFTRQYVSFLRRMSGKGNESSSRSAASVYLEKRYHSKILVREDADKIIRLDVPLRVENPERVIPFDTANRIIIDTPGSIAAIRCPCREGKGEEGCTPREVCLVIGSPYTDFVIEHRTSGARPISRQEALDILEETDKLGWVHTAWFKDAMGGRFYAICNCCSCCCMGLSAMKNSGFTARYILPSGYAAGVDSEKCDACGLCSASCSFGAMEVDGFAAVDTDRCFGCGVCRTRCPQGAVSLSLDPSKGVPMDLDRI